MRHSREAGRQAGGLQPGKISSTANARIKEAAGLGRKRNRYRERRFLIEGEDLLDAALARGIVPRQVFVLEEHEELLYGLSRTPGGTAVPRLGSGAGEGATGGSGAGATEVCICTKEVLAKISHLGSGSRLAAVFDIPDDPLPGDLTGGKGPLLYIAATGDPGNVGTLIRSAAALGASGVALAPGTADPYSPKSLRATMGAIFQITVYLALATADLISRARAAAVPVVCADPHHGEAVWQSALDGDFILVLGAEREGIPNELLEAAGATVRIPQSGKTESLNVAMAGTAILYEALRQRRASD